MVVEEKAVGREESMRSCSVEHNIISRNFNLVKFITKASDYLNKPHNKLFKKVD